MATAEANDGATHTAVDVGAAEPLTGNPEPANGVESSGDDAPASEPKQYRNLSAFQVPLHGGTVFWRLRNLSALLVPRAPVGACVLLLD